MLLQGNWGEEKEKTEKKVRSAAGHRSRVAVKEIIERYEKKVLALRQFDCVYTADKKKNAITNEKIWISIRA